MDDELSSVASLEGLTNAGHANEAARCIPSSHDGGNDRNFAASCADLKHFQENRTYVLQAAEVFTTSMLRNVKFPAVRILRSVAGV